MASQKKKRTPKAHVTPPTTHGKPRLGARPDGRTVLEVLFGNDEAAYEQFIEQDVRVAEDFARKELEYHESLNDLQDNAVEPADMVDEAIARLLEEKRGKALTHGKRLQAMILEVVHDTVNKLEERERRETSIEGNAKDPAEEAGFRTLGEHVLDFWQPDQDLTVQEYIADPDVPTPQEILDMKDRQDSIYKALNALPRAWRENFVLMAVSGWTPEDVATWRGSTVDEVKKELGATQSLLVERLREASALENRPPRQLPHTHERD